MESAHAAKIAGMFVKDGSRKVIMESAGALHVVE